MDNSKVLSTIRLVGTEFNNLKDETVLNWIDLVLPFVSKKIFDDFYYQAAAYMTCHKMKISGLGVNEAGAVNELFNVTGYTEGDTNISYSTSQSNNLNADAEYTLTPYGLQFLTLKQTCVVPIAISGMRR